MASLFELIDLLVAYADLVQYLACTRTRAKCLGEIRAILVLKYPNLLLST